MESDRIGNLQSAPPRRRILLWFTVYLFAYLCGIASCIVFTPVELFLASKLLADVYLWFSLFGFLIFFFGYDTDAAQFWYVGWVGLGVIALGIASFSLKWPWLTSLRPWFLAFPIGFVGAMGAYYTIAASI